MSSYYLNVLNSLNELNEDKLKRDTEEVCTQILLNKENFVSKNKEDLYLYSEKEIVDKIRNCPNKKIRDAFEIFSNSTHVGRSDTEVKDKYCISIKVKKRYTNPLVVCEDGQARRISDISQIGKELIEDIKHYEDSKYAYLNIDL